MSFIGQNIFNDGNMYSIGDKIGEGAFGNVYDCVDSWQNKLVAKVLKPFSRNFDEVKAQWINELSLLVHLRHPNITYAYDAFEHNGHFFLILEKCSVSLDGLFRNGNETRLYLKPVARCILQAIHFIHSAGYVHKDLHPGNVFLSLDTGEIEALNHHTLSIKLGDFGISRLETDINIFNTILANWMLPPEFLNPGTFGIVGKKVDIYHAGLLLLSMYHNQVLQFSRDEILNGEPRKMAEQLPYPLNVALGKALRRTVLYRTNTPLEVWSELASYSAS